MNLINRMRRTTWRKSTDSSMNGICVELARLPNGKIGVRDSKDKHLGPFRPVLDGVGESLIESAKRGDFDKL
jgi:Domain of unknown function (DUF397)